VGRLPYVIEGFFHEPGFRRCRPAPAHSPPSLAHSSSRRMCPQSQNGCGASKIRVHALVRDSHRSCKFVEFLKFDDAAYPAHAAIKLIPLANQPVDRFQFASTPTHGSTRNLIESFFSKLVRSVLRHVRLESKEELKDRITAATDVGSRASSVSVLADVS
jgi:hypothetical protein